MGKAGRKETGGQKKQLYWDKIRQVGARECRQGSGLPGGGFSLWVDVTREVKNDV